MQDSKLYANLKKCVFFAQEIPVLGCYVNSSSWSEEDVADLFLVYAWESYGIATVARLGKLFV